MLETDNSLTSAISKASRFRAQASGGSDFGLCVRVRHPRECRNRKTKSNFMFLVELLTSG